MKTPFYLLGFSPDKELLDYIRALEKASFSRTAEVLIDFEILEQRFSNELILQIENKGLNWSAKTSPQNFETYNQKNPLLKNCKNFYVFFQSSAELSSLDSSSLKENITFVVQPNLTTDFLNLPLLFYDHQLFFAFSHYDSKDPLSLTVSDVHAKIRMLNKRYPDFKVLPLPFYEVFDHRIPSQIKLEPEITAPRFKFGDNNAFDFSFIIPTFNSKYFLLNVVRHLLKMEKSSSYEIIIVDDGGTDDSAAALLSFLKNETQNFDLSYFYWPKPAERPTDFFRAGLCRNLGAGHSRGKNLVFLDSDILVPTTFLSDLAKNLESNDVIQYVRKHIVPQKSSSHVVPSDLDRDKDIYIEDSKYWQPFFETDKWSSLPFFWKYTCTYCLAMSADNFFSSGRFRRTFVSYGFEDTDLGYRLKKMGLRFYLSKVETFHLTQKNAQHSGVNATFRRHIALSKTAKNFFLHSLDTDVYEHFILYMGGERSLVSYLLRLRILLQQYFQRAKKTL